MPTPLNVPLAIAGTALLALQALSTGCGMGPEPASRSLALTECRLPRLSVTAQCGELSVPEDRARPDGRKIGIFVAVLPANTVAPRSDPLVILAGGPGQAASQLAPLASRLSEVRRTRDIVLVDQRGTGRSAPLKCAAFKPDDGIEASFDLDSVAKAGDCLRELAATGVDLKQYTTEAWVADLDAVRAALGYPQVNLWGGSYGTRVALAYLRRHPDRVRSMVLDGVAPPEMAVPRDVWLSREKALDGVLAACAASEPCRRAHPDLAQKLDRLERDYAAPGRRVEFTDPRTGKATAGTVSFDLILGSIHAMTYAPERAALAARGHRPRRRRRLRSAAGDGAGRGRRHRRADHAGAALRGDLQRGCAAGDARGTARARPVAQPGAGGEHVRRLRDLAQGNARGGRRERR